MKFSILKNDKTTYWDEVILAIIIACSLSIGIMLIVFRPSFWLISSDSSCQFGILIALFGFMYIPGLIYRLMTNDKE